jgi:hypothetical protein
VKAESNYKKRYKYEGNLQLDYASNIVGEKGLSGYSKDQGFFIRWQHKQDPKARPNSNFSANVSAGSSNYNKYNATNAGDYLSNDFESSIAYQATFGQGRCNFTGNLGFKQNTGTKEMILRAPELSFSVNRFYPFRKKNKIKLQWWDNISISYVMNAINRLDTYDSLFWNIQSLKQMQNGIQHTIPISSTIKLLKYISWNNTFNYAERWYFHTIDKEFVQTSDTAYIKTNTIDHFATERDFNYSSTLNTKIYATYELKKGALKAVRHVMTPSISFGYRPDFGSSKWGYYKYTVTDISGDYQKYSRFPTGIYSSPPDGRSGKVNFDLANNLEMKVRSRKDTVTGTKKVHLIDDLTIHCGYDLAKDSMNWDNLTISARTRFFDRIDVSYAGSWDPYAIDAAGNRIKKTEWQVKHRLFRPNSFQWNVSVALTLSAKDFQKKGNKAKQNSGTNPVTQTGSVPETDYTNPWSLSINYNLVYGSYFNYSTQRFVKDTTNGIGITGNIAVTKKWNFRFMTNYDVVKRKFSYTSITVSRDLHCWEMELNWIPMGFRQSYNFTIHVKASVLKDLKLTKKTDWRDYY